MDTIQDAYRNEFGKPATAAVLTHCKRELMHAIWCHLLDNKFMEAYVNGMPVECTNGYVRRFFPRIFTYSADYPEKYVFKLSHFLMLSEPVIGRFLRVSRTLGPFHAHDVS